MDGQIRAGGFSILPPVVKNLLIINGLFFLAKIVFGSRGVDLDAIFGLHYFTASEFRPWQIITYMFMHGDFGHIFFNMFALWMFGSSIENAWGGKRFISYYLITGIGAALIHYIIIYFQIHPTLVLLNHFLDNPNLETYQYLAQHNTSERFQTMLTNNLYYLQQNPDSIHELVNVTTTAKENFLNSFNIIGASGSVFGLLLAFGMLFPNAQIYLYFLLPIKAKWFVIIYGALELLYGVTGSSDGIAHFAHLGGMLFGIILILVWRKYDRKHFDNHYFG
ncbi:MAG: rhomboid family intramembrane serine protease [Bacteroidales bacterium]